VCRSNVGKRLGIDLLVHKVSRIFGSKKQGSARNIDTVV
jgi:hypothetical protein